MSRPTKTRIRMAPEKILWRRGKFAVIEGPFPPGLVRSYQRLTVEEAIKSPYGAIESDSATGRAGRYAKILLSDIEPTHNEWGEYGP